MNHNKHSHGSANAADAFLNAPVSVVIIKNCIPALIAMTMVMVYNLADTFFIGLTHDDMQVAAVSLATPVFMVFMSLGTLFGVGGTSVISRALGAGKNDYAKKVSSFCMWSCVAVGLVLMVVLWAFAGKIATVLGASPDTMDYTMSYLTITVGCGVFSMLSNCFSNVIRTEGAPMKAMTGTVIGNLVNIVLDPIMILALDMGITGAAIATVIGNAVAAAYYIFYFIGGKSSLSINIRHFSLKDGIFSGVISVGLSASLVNLLSSLSAIIVNNRLSTFDDMYVAGYGVTSKIAMIVTLIGIGIGSGAQPFFGFCYGAKNRQRMMSGLRFAIFFGVAACAAASVLCGIFASPIAKLFLTNDASLECAVHFTRILMSTSWLVGAFIVCQTTLQAVGAATPALLASVLRQGIIFIPAVFVLGAILGIDGFIWAQPVIDVISLVIIAFLLAGKLRKKNFEPAE